MRGLRLATLSPEGMQEVTRRFAAHGVVYFRNVGPDFGPERHMEFAQRLGGINVNRFFPQVEGHEGIAKVEKTPKQKEAIGDVFHADHTYDLAPALGSMVTQLGRTGTPPPRLRATSTWKGTPAPKSKR